MPPCSATVSTSQEPRARGPRGQGDGRHWDRRRSLLIEAAELEIPIMLEEGVHERMGRRVDHQQSVD